MGDNKLTRISQMNSKSKHVWFTADGLTNIKNDRHLITKQVIHPELCPQVNVSHPLNVLQVQGQIWMFKKCTRYRQKK